MTKARSIHINILGLILLLSSQAILAQSYTSQGPANTRVYFNSDEKVFPRVWRNKKINPIATSVAMEKEARLNAITETALNKYSVKVLSKNLRRVYILRTMMFFGLEYGGTYHKRKVYITDNGVDRGYTDKYIEGTFHHEFSSIILKKYYNKFDEAAWFSANPKGFTYGDGGMEALKTEQSSLAIDSSLVKQGFLNEYSLASLEEDFNCFAEFIFIADEVFWYSYDISEAVRQKADILISFYHSIDPVFTLDYFKDAIPK